MEQNPQSQVQAVTRLNPDMWFKMPPEGRDAKCVGHTYDTSKMPGVAVVIPYLKVAMGRCSLPLPHPEFA